MDKKALPTEYLPESYRTGDVQPPKSHRGLVTFLLLLVIFLGGLISGLSFAGIHLFRLLQNTGEKSVLFIEAVQPSMASEQAGFIQIDGLGIEGCLLSSFDQAYFDFPQGIYITHSTSPDFHIGDILLGVNGETFNGQAGLVAMLQSYSPGEAITLDIYRDGSRHTLTAILENPDRS